jgi:ABC-2 type transport system permease protein
MILQACVVLLVATIAGVHIKTGLLGVFFIVVISSLFGLALGGINTIVALQTRNTEATFLVGNFINLPLMFTSSAMLPKSMLPDWMQAIAKLNPVTYGVEGMRGLITTGFDPGKVFSAVLILGAVATITILAATLMFRSRVA